MRLYRGQYLCLHFKWITMHALWDFPLPLLQEWITEVAAHLDPYYTLFYQVEEFVGTIQYYREWIHLIPNRNS